jgi:hypothetical protein
MGDDGITVGTKNAIDSFDVIRVVNIQHTFSKSSSAAAPAPASSSS